MSNLICEFCSADKASCKGVIERRRQNTKYVNEEDNYKTLCEKHYEENEEHWADMWDDLLANVL